jgi:hypothetical protein
MPSELTSGTRTAPVCRSSTVGFMQVGSRRRVPRSRGRRDRSSLDQSRPTRHAGTARSPDAAVGMSTTSRNGDRTASIAARQAWSTSHRPTGSFELRVFIGLDPTTKRHRYRSTTVRAGRGDAERQLAAMVASVQAARWMRVPRSANSSKRGSPSTRPVGCRPRSDRPAGIPRVIAGPSFGAEPVGAIRGDARDRERENNGAFEDDPDGSVEWYRAQKSGMAVRHAEPPVVH